MKRRLGRFLFYIAMTLCALLALSAYALVLYRTAWLSDDAYISYRTVENFTNGHGLTWNVKERVQAYTHPLWLFVNLLFYQQTGNMFVAGITAAVVVSLLAVALASARLSATSVTAVLLVLLCLCSKAFIDYSTSGLENPLSHLILALFLLAFFRRQRTHFILFLLALLAALAMLTRMDLILLFAPALLYAWSAERSLRATLVMASGFLPLLAWEIFSVIYYGFPFPNTAYAKLGTGIASGELALQGLRYLFNSLTVDFFTLGVIALVLLVIARRPRGAAAPIALGILLYLLYVVKIGGDFMSGRFLTVPFFAALILLARYPVKTHKRLWAAALLLALTGVGLAEVPPFATGAEFGAAGRGGMYGYGIADERRFYYQQAGLLHAKDPAHMPTHHFAQQGRAMRQLERDIVKPYGSVGYRGFFGGPRLHIIDYYALTDPLLARLPAKYNPHWRIGHFVREIPAGYVRTQETGENKLADPQLKEFYDALQRITRAPLWDKDRWTALVQMNLGLYDHLVNRDVYRFPNLIKLDARELATPKPAGLRWNASGNIILEPPMAGFDLDLGPVQHAGGFESSLDWNDPWCVVFMRGEEVAGTVFLRPPPPMRGLAVYRQRIPTDIIRPGYDRVRLLLQGRDKISSLGHFRLIN